MRSKKMSFAIISSVSVVILATVLYKQASAPKLYTAQDATTIIQEVYEDLSGFSIDDTERKMIEDAGGNATYGEITPEALGQLIDYFKLAQQDVFFDLGSGVGKVCVQVALTTPATAIGIELSPARYQMAQQAKEALMSRKILTKANKLQFYEQNILDADLSKGTVFFTCSTCFSDALMQTLTQKIASSGKHVRVATLRQLPENQYFALDKVFNLKMTWSENSPVYVYKQK